MICSRGTFSAQRRKKGQSEQRVFSLAETTLYVVKYSGLYFTWKSRRIKTNNRRFFYVHGSSENAKNESS